MLRRPLGVVLDHFRSGAFKEFLQANQVVPLYSPRRRARYNGGVERANQTLKTATHYQAMRRGSFEQWSSVDVETARQIANQITRPWGKDGPSPNEVWQSRRPLADARRSAFAACLDVIRAQLGPAPVGSHYVESAFERRCVSKALQQSGLLVLHPARPRKPLPPPNGVSIAMAQSTSQTPQPVRPELKQNKIPEPQIPKAGHACKPPDTISTSRDTGRAGSLGERLVHFGQGLMHRVRRLIPPPLRPPKTAIIRDG